MNEQRKKFADRYFETLNGTQSAIYAGYSELSAKSKASQLLDEDEVINYLTTLRAKEAVKHNLTLDRWLSELEAVGFSNVQDFISEGNNIKDISKLPEVKAKAVLSVKKSVTEFEGGEKVVTEFKLHDKLNALEKIGRHFDYYNADSSSKNTTTNVINLGGGVKPDEATS